MTLQHPNMQEAAKACNDRQPFTIGHVQAMTSKDSETTSLHEALANYSIGTHHLLA
jgi:hypothetical protein